MQSATLGLPGASTRWLLALMVAAGIGLFAIATPARADAPTITSVTPDTGSALGQANVIIEGTNFQDVASTDITIMFGAVEAESFTVVDDTTISVTAPAQDPGTVNVTVDADGLSNDDMTFTYHPVVTNVSPGSGPQEGGNTVTLSGGGFSDDSIVTFGGVAATDVNANAAGTSMTVTAPLHSAGEVNVVVTTDSIASPVTAQSVYTYGLLPTITEVAPNTGPTGGGTAIEITGTNFTGATSVTVGGNAATSVVVVDSTTITAVTPAHAAGEVQVRVTTPVGISAEGDAAEFTYTGTGTVPTVTSLNPSSGPTVGGTVVEITGTNLTGATAVTFGTTAATSFTVNSATSITAVAPALVAGAANVTVTTPAGTSVASGGSQFTAVGDGPVITDLEPAGGPVAGGTVVEITGTGFTGATAVSFGGTAATNFTVNSSTSITATAPSRPAGTVFVIVTTPVRASSPTVASQYTYGDLPTITGINPTSGPITGGTEVTITGTGFTGATAVMFGSTAAADFDVVSDTTITATAPAHAAGDVFIRVTTPTGQSAEVAVAEFSFGGSDDDETITYTLQFRWTLIAWLGENGISVTNALTGPGEDATNDISGQVTAIYRWDAPSQAWEGNFPGETAPGVNDFTTLAYGQSYFIAISTSGTVSWIVEAGPDVD